MNKYDFGTAKDFLKQGMKLAREGWNGKGMFVIYVASEIVDLTKQQEQIFGVSNIILNEHFLIKNANNTISTWVPSINDCLAEDWYIVD